jgi:hypothetical protein
MVIVQRHGARRRILNPVTNKWQETINVTFVEPDRAGGANSGLANSSQALSAAIGMNVGLNQLRTHTQPVLASAIGEFPIGKEFPTLFVNRTLYSTPQMQQQEGVDARMLDGKPTYFVTELGDQQKEDIDQRLDSNVLATVDKNLFKNARTRQTAVEEIEQFGGSRDVHDFDAQGVEPVDTRSASGRGNKANATSGQ